MQQRSQQYNQLQNLTDDLNTKIRRLQEEINALQEQPLNLGEVIKVQSETRCLVK